jgi:hypothetical protein
MLVRQAAPDESCASQNGQPGRGADRVVAELVPARAFFQRVFEVSQKERHQHDAEVVGIGQQLQVGPVDPDQHRHGDRYEDAWNQIDEEQPVP